MTLVSNAPAAKSYLIGILRTALPTSTVNGYPVTDADWSGENVYVDSTDFEQDWIGGFGTQRQDDFTFNMAILVRQLATPDVVEARCWTLLGSVQEAVHGDPLFGGLLSVAADVSGGNVSAYPATPDGDWEARAELRVRCQSRMTV